MREENRHPGAELNDAALSGVSGGYDQDALEKATRICKQCWRDARGCTNGRPALLAPYVGSVHQYDQCPYYDGPPIPVG